MVKMQNVMIFGASGGIGEALCKQLVEMEHVQQVCACSRSPISFAHPKIRELPFDLLNEGLIEEAVQKASMYAPIDLAIVATGILDSPEKHVKQLNVDALRHYFDLNTIGPSLVAKHVLPHLNRKKQSIFAALSARVGSISDNHLGGWYGYRASKAALNMMIKCAAIETSRLNPNAIVIGLHPGTVDTELSKPFQKNVPTDKLFSPHQSAQYLLDVILSRTGEDNGKIFAWDRSEIIP